MAKNAPNKPAAGIKISKAEKERFAKIAGQTASANYKKKVGGPIGPDARANIEVAAEKRTMKTFDSKKSTAAKPKPAAPRVGSGGPAQAKPSTAKKPNSKFGR